MKPLTDRGTIPDQRISFRDTKYWIKRDLETFRKATLFCIKFTPILLFISSITTLLLFNGTNYEIDYWIKSILVIYAALFLCLHMVYVLSNKGYGVDLTRQSYVTERDAYLPKHINEEDIKKQIKRLEKLQKKL